VRPAGQAARPVRAVRASADRPELVGRCRTLSPTILELDRELHPRTETLAPRLLALAGCGHQRCEAALRDRPDRPLPLKCAARSAGRRRTTRRELRKARAPTYVKVDSAGVGSFGLDRSDPPERPSVFADRASVRDEADAISDGASGALSITASGAVSGCARLSAEPLEKRHHAIRVLAVKVGIVCPFSWSYLGGVGEHAEGQAEALEALGVETKVLSGDDPPGSVSRLFHPDAARTDARPSRVISVGTTVTVPANGSRAHIVLSPLAVLRLRKVLERERFDLLHVHEPMTPALCVAALAFARCPIVATWHATDESSWTMPAVPLWGFLMDRIDYRIAVSPLARAAAARYRPGDYEIIPNGIMIPDYADPAVRRNTVAYVGRNDPRKGLEVLLRAWPEVRRRTGARLRLIGADPQSVRLLMARRRLSEEGVDLLGVIVGEPLSAELGAARALVAPSLGGESFGMALVRAFGCATPVVCSDIPGYAQVMSPEVGILVPPGDPEALAEALIALLEDEPRRRNLGAAARTRALERYAWSRLARRLIAVYEELTSPPGMSGSVGVGPASAAAAVQQAQFGKTITSERPR
jgi:phosphatidylinositol alpha-mannosyltransferase